MKLYSYTSVLQIMKGLGKLLVEHKGNENAYSLRFYKTKSRLNTSQTGRLGVLPYLLSSAWVKTGPGICA